MAIDIRQRVREIEREIDMQLVKEVSSDPEISAVVEVLFSRTQAWAAENLKPLTPLSEKAQKIRDYIFRGKPLGCQTREVAGLISLLLDEPINESNLIYRRGVAIVFLSNSTQPVLDEPVFVLDTSYLLYNRRDTGGVLPNDRAAVRSATREEIFLALVRQLKFTDLETLKSNLGVSV